MKNQVKNSFYLVLLLIGIIILSGCTQQASGDFEDGDYDGWGVISGTASIQAGNLTEGKYVLQLSGSGETKGTVLCNVDNSLNWANYVAEFDAEIADGNDAWSYLNFYVYSQSVNDANNAYKLHLRAEQDSMTLGKVVDGSFVFLDTVNRTFDFEKIYHVKIVVSNGNIKAYIDGELMLDVNDDTYKRGTVGIETHTGGGSWTWVESNFDNIKVKHTNYK